MKTKNALTLCLEENCNVYHVRLEIVFFNNALYSAGN